jgi:SAM-dependent methyltransferase
MDLREMPGHEFVRHPWEAARFHFFRQVLARHGLDRLPSRVLDVGSGDAWFAAQLVATLPRGSEIVCWDAGYEPGRSAPAPGIRLTSTAPEGPFDAALLLDVIEHVGDDAGFMRDVVARMAHPGTVLVSVPAWNRLMSGHDVALGHHRRYDPRSGRAVLEAAGLSILESGGLFHSLLVPRAAALAVERIRGRRNGVGHELAWRWGRAAAAVVGGVLSLDNAVSGLAARVGVELPGLSWWALCATSRS